MPLSKNQLGFDMIRSLRLLILIVSIASLIYSIYMYLHTPSSLYYIIGGISAVLTAFVSYKEIKEKKNPQGITSGENSTNIIVNGNKNKTKVKRGG